MLSLCAMVSQRHAHIVTKLPAGNANRVSYQICGVDHEEVDESSCDFRTYRVQVAGALLAANQYQSYVVDALVWHNVAWLGLALA